MRSRSVPSLIELDSTIIRLVMKLFEFIYYRAISEQIARSRSVTEVIDKNSLNAGCFGYTCAVGSAHPTFLRFYN